MTLSLRTLRWPLLFAVGLALAGLLSGCRGKHRDVDPEKAYKFVSFAVDDKLDDLKASDEQRVKLHEVKDKVFDAAMALKDNGKEWRKTLVTEWLSDKPNADKMHEQVDLAVEELRKAGHLAVDSSLEVHDILSAEQRSDLAKMIAEHAEDR